MYLTRDSPLYGELLERTCTAFSAPVGKLYDRQVHGKLLKMQQYGFPIMREVI